MTIIALTDVKLLALGRDTLIGILGNQVDTIINQNICRWAIEKEESL